MADSEKGVHELLRELQSQLDQVRSPEDRERLTNLVTDIRSRLGAHLDEDPQQELIDELREEVIEFEADHPDAAATIHSLINMLSNLGI